MKIITRNEKETLHQQHIQETKKITSEIDKLKTEIEELETELEKEKRTVCQSCNRNISWLPSDANNCPYCGTALTKK